MEFLIKYEYIRMIENIHPSTSLQPVPLATRQGNPKLEVLDVQADNACGLVQAWHCQDDMQDNGWGGNDNNNNMSLVA